MAENNHKALSKVINSIVGNKIAMAVVEEGRVGFKLSDGRVVWVQDGPEGKEIGFLKVEKK